MNIITSRDNSKLKHVRKVRDGSVPDEIFIEGVRLAGEALRSNAKIVAAFIASNVGIDDREARLIEKLEATNVPIIYVDDKLFRSIADTKNSQGVVFICRRPDTSFSHFANSDIEKAGNLAIFLNKINNPSNLGAILRTAEAAGVANVIVSNDSADVFSPKALRASMGAALRLNIWEDAAFDDVVDWAGKQGMKTTAADIRAEDNYTDIAWDTPRLLVFGSEAEGLSDRELADIEEPIKIPMENDVESLNLAVSCGIILFEAKRQNSSIG